MNFLDRVSQLYGNPRAIFATAEKIPNGTPLKIFVEDESRLIDAVSAGKKEKGCHVVSVKKKDRSWRLRMRPRNILIAW